MPLLDLKTKLKDLKYGTVAPYIQKDINNPGTPASNQVQARIDDVSRIAKMFVDSPGANFASKLLVLETSKALSNNPEIRNTIVNPVSRIASIFAQIPVNGTGTHFLFAEQGRDALFYARVKNASSQAKDSGTVTIPTPDRRSKVKRQVPLTAWEDGYENPKTGAGRGAKANATVQLNKYVEITQPDGTKKSYERLSSKYAMADKDNGYKGTDVINLLDVGSGAVNFDLVPIMFGKFGNWSDTKLLFRGHLQNLQDNYNGNWSSTSYVGRMEQFFTYTGFTRTLGFQLVVPMFSEEEQPIVYNKLNSLLSLTAPTYNNRLPQGNITTLVVGNYVRTNGILTNVSTTVATDVPWSYSSEDAYGVDAVPRLLPQVITLNIQFTPIHAQAPQYYGKAFKPGVKLPFINHGTEDLSQLIPQQEITGLTNKASILDPFAQQTGVKRQLQLPPLNKPGSNIFKNLGNLFKKKKRPVVTTDDVEIFDIDDEFVSIP